MHRAHLNKDPRFRRILPELEEIVLDTQDKVYLRICRSILSQQLSVHVARVIYGRFLALFNNQEPSLHQILETAPNILQNIGFSRAKSRYVHNVCAFFLENKIVDKKLFEMTDEEVIDLLTQIKGVGRWTVEMILIFAMGREDVFPVDDLVIRNAVIQLYNIKESDKKKLREKLVNISEQWAPYRTYAARYLWMWKDGGGL